MENPRPEKVAVVDEVRERMSSASAVLLTEYRGLHVGELAQLRRSLRSAGGDYKIYKNTLVRFAARDLGLTDLEELLVGPTALAFVDGDAAAVAKALRDYARTNPNLVVKGGVLGDKLLTGDEARALADLPSREVLLARIAGGLAAPLQQFAGLLQALPRNLAYGLQALIDQGGAPGAPAPAPVDQPAEDTPPTADASDEPAGREPAEGGDAEVDSQPGADAAPDAATTGDEQETRNDEAPGAGEPLEREPAEGGDAEVDAEPGADTPES